MLRWLPTLWFGFVILRYSSASFQALHESPANPLDMRWTTAWLVFAAAVILSAAILKRSLVSRIWWTLFAVTGAATLVLSHTVLPALTALAILFVAAGVGEFAFLRFRLAPGPLLERLVLAVPVGIGVLALGQFAIALLGFFNRGTSWLLLLMLAVPAIQGMRSLRVHKLEAELPLYLREIIPLGYIFLLNLSWATAPEIQYDAVNVHLAVPRLYLSSGRLIDLPYFWNSYMAHLLSMVYGLCLSLQGQLSAKFLILSFGVLAAAGVYLIGRKFFNDEVGIWAALLFYSTPLVVWSSDTTYLDLAQTFFVAASAIAFIKWYERSEEAWLAVGGWIGGVAAGNKVAVIATLIMFPIIAAARVLARTFRQKTFKGLWLRLRPIAAYVVLFVIVAAPWYLVVYMETGNPFFPLLNKIFRSPAWPAENTNLDWGTFGMGTSLRSLLLLPLHLSVESNRFSTVRGGVGFGLLLVFPLALIYLWKGSLPQRTLLLAVGLHMAVWAFTAQYARYYIIVLPFVAVLGCAALLYNRAGSTLKWNRALLAIGVIIQAPVASILFWNIPERFPIERAFGRESEDSFLERGLPGYKSARFLNGVAKPGQKILGVGVEQVRFYFDDPLYTQTYFNLAEHTPVKLRSRLVEDGFAYIVAANTSLTGPPPWFGYLQPEFLDLYAEALYRDEFAVVFRIRNQ